MENASYRLAYYIMAFGSMVVIAYRGFLFQESLWDLMFLVIVSSAVATFYQSSKQVLPPSWRRLAAIIFIVSVILAALLAFLLR